MHLQAHPWWPEWCIDALILRSNHLHHMSISEYICIYYQSEACDANWNFFAIHLGEIFKPPRRQLARIQVRNVTDKGPRFGDRTRIEMHITAKSFNFGEDDKCRSNRSSTNRNASTQVIQYLFPWQWKGLYKGMSLHNTFNLVFSWWWCGYDADDDDSVGCQDAVGSSWAKRGVNLGRGSALAQH